MCFFIPPNPQKYDQQNLKFCRITMESQSDKNRFTEQTFAMQPSCHCEEKVMNAILQKCVGFIFLIICKNTGLKRQ